MSGTKPGERPTGAPEPNAGPISGALAIDPLALPLDRIGCAELERLVCNPDALGAIDAVQPRNDAAWRIDFPSLASLPVCGGPEKRLRICIATEDIVGPVRNGGIGTTYAYLAEMLAQMGFDVTILYLRGQEIENGTIEDWAEHYGHKGVRFVPAPNYAAQDRFRTGADRWLQTPYNMLRYLLENPMDVVHVSEWHGCGYLTLLAKQQGLGFEKTLFIVKTSSPWLWIRLYGSQPLERIEDLAKIHAERQSVELGDMVVGGSLHLLRWMASQGYRIPAHNTFVQPNIAFFDHLGTLASVRAGERQTRLPVSEIAFFGRLEARKGLFVFCQAIKRLIRAGVPLPPTISFVGKPGARLTARPDQDILEYIKSETANWPCEIKLLTNLQQYEALEYLLSGPRLAVMPSIIENSSMAVYEAAICGIPFIASTSGGTPELVAQEDRDEVLCESHPVTLSEKIERALSKGAYIARPSFSNDQNIETWKQFHDSLRRGLHEQLLTREAPVAQEKDDIRFSICIYHPGGDAALQATIDSLRQQDLAPLEVRVAVDADEKAAVGRAREMCRDLAAECVVFEAFDYDAGLAFNMAARLSSGEYLLFLWSGTALRPQALRALSKVARSGEFDLLSFFHRVTFADGSPQSGYLRATILGSVSESYFRMDLTAFPFAIRAASFVAVDGFSSDYRVLGAEMELVARCQVQGFKCTTALMELATVPGWETAWLRKRGYDESASHFRIIRPQLGAVPLALRDLLLVARGLQLRFTRGKPRRPAAAATADSLSKRVLKTLAAGVTMVAPRKNAEGAASSLPPAPKKRGEADLSALIGLIDGVKPPRRKKPEPAPARKNDFVERLRKQLYTLTDADGDIYTGRILGLHRGVVYGWARDENRPDEPLEIHVFEDGERKRIIRADQDIDSAVPLPADLRRHGFSFSLKSRWPFARKKKLRRIELGFGAGGQLKFAELTLGQPAEAAGVESYCDPSRSGILHGWIWRPERPDDHVDVAVFVDGKFLARLTAAGRRDDLLSAGIGHGDHAFQVQIPKALRDGAERRIDVVVADDGVPLEGSPMTLTGDEILPG